jgi:hypothetical protein
MIPMSHVMVPTITLLDTLNFIYLFKLKKYIKLYSTNITLDSTNITYAGRAGPEENPARLWVRATPFMGQPQGEKKISYIEKKKKTSFKGNRSCQ